MGSVQWEQRAVEDLAEIASKRRGDAHRILSAVRRLGADGTGDIKKLQAFGTDTWRLRVGDWRVRFLYGGDGAIVVVAVANRRDAYD